jgi:hypothetical protein
VVAVQIEGFCNDRHSCTTDECVGAPDGDAKGCKYTPVHTKCEDDYGCTTDTCTADGRPGEDAGTGCTRTANHDVCADGYTCSTEMCSASGAAGEVGGSKDVATSGCLTVRNHDECDAGSICTDNTCVALTSLDPALPEDGCTYAPDNSKCTGASCAERLTAGPVSALLLLSYKRGVGNSAMRSMQVAS